MQNDNKTQADRFKEAARELDADDDDKHFEDQLKKLVKRKPDDK